MDFSVLGPLEIRSGGVSRRLLRTKPRVVLALLLARANQPISAGRLRRELWGGSAPRSAAANLYTYMRAIRELMLPDEPARLTCDAAGYTLVVDDTEVDALRARALIVRARDALRRGDLSGSSDLFDQAARLWRGQPLADLPLTHELEVWVRRLDEQHHALLRDWTDVRLQLGQGAELVGDLRAEAAADPLCERVHAQLMLALYRAGRVGEALTVYAGARRIMAEHLGMEPGPLLSALHRAILHHDSSLEPDRLSRWVRAQCGEPVATGRGLVAAGPTARHNGPK